MKNLIFLFFCISMYALVSCDNTNGGGKNLSPEETMNGFIEKLKAKDFQGAKEFTSDETDAFMDLIPQRVKMLEEMGKKDQINEMFGGVDFGQEIKITCKDKENKGVCECCQEITGDCNTINLIQQGGKWLVHIPKESTVEE